MRRFLLILVASLATLSLVSCKGDNEEPTPGPGPTPQSEITSNNAAPAGFADDGPMDWDE